MFYSCKHGCLEGTSMRFDGQIWLVEVREIPGSLFFLIKICPLERGDKTVHTVKVSKWMEALL